MRSSNLGGDGLLHRLGRFFAATEGRSRSIDRDSRRTRRSLARLALTVLIPLAANGQSLWASEPGIDELPIEDYEREHWAWRPLERPEVPAVDDAAWCRTAIDHFILAKLQRRELRPTVPADRATLVRRVYFDLTGLPPSPQQVDHFVNDPRPDAYERLVDELLASDDYGRHVATSWLDLARFAETDGFEHDHTRPHAYRYRDWVIASLNSDRPYDEFAALQIAGDVLKPDDESAAIATAFCLSGPDMPDINLQEERRAFLLNDITDTVGAVFLALQTGCAQCHDHKFDPISQADYYRLRACFQPSVQVTKNKTVDLLVRHNGTPEPSHLLIRGDWRRTGAEVQPGVPRIADPWQTEVDEETDEIAGGRRAALARWLTRRDHPLTSRVIVNRIWQHHFGVGLSRTPNDFGYIGDDPLHTDLLDFLATELVQHGWSRKWLDREIVLSATYRQSGPGGSIEAEEVRLYAHYPRQRLTGEEIRDAMLLVSGLLSRVGGGESVYPPLPRELLSTIRKDHWDESEDAEEHHRRSVYIFARRNLPYPLFEAFDRPAALTSCPQRNESTTAIQSLAMWNSEFAHKVAESLSEQAAAVGDGDVQHGVRWLVDAVLGHDADGEVMQACLAHVNAWEEDAAEEVLLDVALALLNSNAFLYVE